MSETVAVLGLGAMGSRMAARLLKAGYQVKVWNRSPDRARALVNAGAQLAHSPREAAAEADFVMAMVRDDAASLHVWCDNEQGALAAMKVGAVAIESSTLSVEAIRQLAHAATTMGVSFLDAPVSGSRPAAEAGQLVYLVGGDEAAFQRTRPLLLTLGATARHVGPVGHGALSKLVTNALLGIHVTALAELIGLLRQQDVAPESILQAVATTPVWSPVDHYLAGSMLAGDFSPQFPVELIAKDFSYALATAKNQRSLPLTTAALAVFEEAIRSALGDSNMTAVAQLYSNQSSD